MCAIDAVSINYTFLDKVGVVPLRSMYSYILLNHMDSETGVGSPPSSNRSLSGTVQSPSSCLNSSNFSVSDLSFKFLSKNMFLKHGKSLWEQSKAYKCFTFHSAGYSSYKILTGTMFTISTLFILVRSLSLNQCLSKLVILLQYIFITIFFIFFH